MQGAEVYDILTRNRVTHLHHANTVTTSCTFLSAGGLVSRGSVEKNKLLQTPQYSDSLDKFHRIWDDIFTDSVDIHARASNRNQYGPVLFSQNISVLLSLPVGTEVNVTRKNPTKWINGEADGDRYFLTPWDLSLGFSLGTFDQMIVLRTPNGFLPFEEKHVGIVLDDPRGKLRDGSDAYTSAEAKLRSAAKVLGINVSIRPRVCKTTCKCVAKYASVNPLDGWF